MKRIFTFLVFGLAFCIAGTGVGQQRTITGNVVSAEDNTPLPGVSVLIKGTTTGTVTDADGNYALSAPSTGTTLVFSFIGYVSLEVEIGTRTVINASMETDITELTEVVVTAFGVEQEKKARGYAVQDISGEEIVENRRPNLLNALQGKVAGVTIQSAGGAPGAGSSIIIRGITSLSPGADNQPLFVIDGIPVSNQTISGSHLPSAGTNESLEPGGQRASGSQFSFSNRMADINPDDIESISILKGPAATALYGLRAANGAVIITTKKGAAGATRINFSTSFGWDQVNKTPEIQESYREGRFGRLRFRSNGNPLRFQSFGPRLSEFDPVINNMEEFFQTGYRFDNNLSISGGNDKTTFFTSVSRLDQEGIVPFSEWDRTSVKVSGSTRFSDRFSLSSSVNFINSGGVRSNGGDKSIMSALSYYSPTFDVNDYINPDGTQRDFSDGIIDNPRYLAEFSTLEDDVNRIIGNVGLDLRITDWLKVDYRVGADYYGDVRRRVAPPGLDVSAQVNGFIVEENVNYTEINSNLILTASKDLSEDLNLSLSVGHNLTDIQFERVNVRGEGFTLREFNDLSNASNFFTSKDESVRRIIGVFADFKLDYRNMLFLNVTGRNDISSTLPSDNRSFFYPSVSLSYVFTESFDINSDILSFGKLRASYAQVGKDAAPYQIGTYFEATPGFPFGSINGFRVDELIGSNDLKPERTSSYEFGTDLRFLNNRFRIDATYFIQNSKDQIVPVPISNATGFSRFITNAGEIQNKGIELLVSGDVLRRGDFVWNAALNFSKIEGEVKSMPEGIDEIIFQDEFYIQNKIVEGGKLGDLYGFAFQRDDEGRLIIEDDGFPRVNTEEYVLVGNALPDWQGGLNNTFSYKGFSLSFLLEVRQGGDVFDLGLRNGIRNGVLKETENRYKEVIFNGVTTDGQENIQAVRLDGESVYRNFTRYNTAAEVVLQDASWFRIRNASLSYDLPGKLLEQTPLRSARVSFTGNNLLLSTPYRGYDPEASQFGAGSNSFGFAGLVIPQTRSFTVSLNVTL